MGEKVESALGLLLNLAREEGREGQNGEGGGLLNGGRTDPRPRSGTALIRHKTML